MAGWRDGFPGPDLVDRLGARDLLHVRAMNPDIGGRDVKEAQTEQEKTWILTGSDEHEERDLIKRGNRQPEVEFD
ncbi:hypothetical protein NDU88_004756 [Pleurodeles waltl]|uniref:Uncharacterized protein n=1 Tax=Pleurodeles waltl TaxID=8319 RepID=A0AAV7LMG0_PLEWA|nr:hypothetical protein NDU88_004756 [Pleurodeles waltl]